MLMTVAVFIFGIVCGSVVTGYALLDLFRRELQGK